MDTLGLLLALYVTPANEQDRAQVGRLTAAMQDVTEGGVEIAFADQGYTGEQAVNDAAAHGVHLEVIKLPQVKRGLVLMPRRWVVERSFASMARFRRMARDYERLLQVLARLHFVPFVCLMLGKAASILQAVHKTL